MSALKMGAQSAPTPADLLEPHAAAELFPLLAGTECEAFKADIAERGLIEPIWICDGKLLDGRNRYRACIEIGIKPRFREYKGDSPTAFAWSLNAQRRHLSTSQLDAIGVKMLPGLQAEARKRQFANLKTESIAKVGGLKALLGRLTKLEASREGLVTEIASASKPLRLVPNVENVLRQRINALEAIPRDKLVDADLAARARAAVRDVLGEVTVTEEGENVVAQVDLGRQYTTHGAQERT